jgi:secretion/DNA translocation related CpaE-like protein
VFSLAQGGFMPSEQSALIWVSSPSLAVQVRRVAAAANCAVEDGITGAESATRAPFSDDVPPPLNGGPPSRQQWCQANKVVIDLPALNWLHEQGYPPRKGIAVVADSAERPDMLSWSALVALHAEAFYGLPHDEAKLVRTLAATTSKQPGAGKTIAVVGGCGGAGASVFAGALALTHGRRALLVDLDPLSGGLDLLLGAEGTAGLRWPHLRLEQGRVAAEVLWEVLPTLGGRLAVLAGAEYEPHAQVGATSAASVRVVLESGADAEALTVCDLPRVVTAGSEAALELADMTVVVVSGQVHAYCAARSVVEQVAARCRRVGLVVRGPQGGIGMEDVEDLIGARVLATTPTDHRLARRLETHGLRLTRASPLRSAARAVLDAVHLEAA